jgi:ferritin
MINKEIETALQKQIELEAYASAYYLSMACWMDVEGYEGTAQYLYAQSDEERMHMLKIIHFINDNDGHAEVPSIDRPPKTFDTYHKCFDEVLKQEQTVTASIHKITKLALSLDDHASHNFLQWYISEQMEEEKNVKSIINKLKIIGKDGSGIYMLDKELGGLSPEPTGTLPEA